MKMILIEVQDYIVHTGKQFNKLIALVRPAGNQLGLRARRNCHEKNRSYHQAV